MASGIDALAREDALSSYRAQRGGSGFRGALRVGPEPLRQLGGEPANFQIFSRRYVPTEIVNAAKFRAIIREFAASAGTLRGGSSGSSRCAAMPADCPFIPFKNFRVSESQLADFATVDNEE